MRLPLIKGSKVDGRAEWRDALPQNMCGYAQEVDGDPYFMRTTDGLRSYTTGSGEDRGGIWSERFSKHVRLSGPDLIEIDQFGATTTIGDISISGSGQASFANSFNTIAFVVNGEFYLYNPDYEDLEKEEVELIEKPIGAGDYTDICFIDGYYFLTDSENVWATTIDDEYEVSAIDFAGSDFAPDTIIGCDKATDNKLVVFNRYTIERFYNSAGDQFPFSRISNAAVPIGIVGPKCKVNIGDGSWLVLGGSKEYSPTFYLMTYSYEKISTGEIDSILDTYADYELESSSMEFRDVRDQRLAICHLPRHTLVYDVTLSSALGSPIWYEWKTGDGVWRGINGVYDPRSVGDSSSAWIYGDKDDSRIGKLDRSICTQYDEPIQWSLSTPMVVVGGTVAYMEIISASGHNIVENPNRVTIATSRDGVLYGNDVLIDAGQTGDYQKRLIILRCGDYPLWFSAIIKGYSKTVVALSALNIERTMP